MGKIAISLVNFRNVPIPTICLQATCVFVTAMRVLSEKQINVAVFSVRLKKKLNERNRWNFRRSQKTVMFSKLQKSQ